MDWQKKVSLWWAKNFRPLVVALLVGCGVHYTIYANQLGNFDAVHIGALYTADGWPEHLYWETQQGRWALRLVDMLRGGINQPALSALLMLFLYALAGVLLTDLFAVRSRVAKYLIPLTLVCAPYVAEVETYHYCSVSYALSFLLAVLAVRSVVCGVRFVWLMGTVCLAFALGMYQANLGTAAGLCVMLLLLAVLRRPGEWQATGLTALRMVLMGGSGAALYMLILKLFLRLYDVGLSGINGINTVGMETLRNLPLGLKNAYFDFYAYFFTHGIAQNHYGQIAGYLLLFVLAALAGLRWLVVLHDRKAATAAVVLVAPAARRSQCDRRYQHRGHCGAADGGLAGHRGAVCHRRDRRGSRTDGTGVLLGNGALHGVLRGAAARVCRAGQQRRGGHAETKDHSCEPRQPPVYPAGRKRRLPERRRGRDPGRAEARRVPG